MLLYKIISQRLFYMILIGGNIVTLNTLNITKNRV
jgi:hypothetical protein